MKKLFSVILIALTLSAATAQTTNWQSYEQDLQELLSFSGTVNVTDVVDMGKNTRVELEVSSYGETRPTTCWYEGENLKSCRDNWFY